MSSGILCGFTPITFCRKLPKLQVTRGLTLKKFIKGKHELRRTSSTSKNVEKKKNKEIKRTVSSQISSIDEDSSPKSFFSSKKRISTSTSASGSPSSVKNEKKKVKTQRNGDSEDSSLPCTANFILMVELRKNIFCFRDMIDLPSLDGSLCVNEIIKQTMKDLQQLSPEIVNINRSFEMEGAEMDKMLIFFYEDLRAIGDSWIMDSEWIYRSKYKNSGVGKNKSDRLVEHVLAALDGLIKMTRERFGMMDVESDGRKSFFSSEGGRSFARSVSYSDSNNSFYSDQLTPRSVLPGPMMISSSNSTSPSLWNLRAQALDKLSPVDLKQLALQMLTRRDSGSVYDLDFKDEIIEEVEEGKKVSEKEEEEDDDHIKGSETEHETEVEHHTKANETEHEIETEDHSKGSEAEHKIETKLHTKCSETGHETKPIETEHKTETKHHIKGPEAEHKIETEDHSEGSETEHETEAKHHIKCSETEHESETEDHSEGSVTEHATETEKTTEVERFFDATETEYEIEAEQHIEVRKAEYEIKTEDHIETITSETNVKESSQEEVSVNQVSRPSPPPPPPTVSLVNKKPTPLSQPPPQLENKAPPPPPPPSNTPEHEGFCQILKPQFTKGGSGRRTPAPPAPPGSGRSLRAKKATTKLRRSAQIASLYRVLKGKVEGRNVEIRKTKESKETKTVTEKSSVKGGMADALAEMTKRSSYFQQIEEDVHNYTKSLEELKSSIQSFQPKDMKELLEFHSKVESVLEKLSDETQVLARFEGFPEKKLEAIRTAGALYNKLDGILVELKNWKIEPPLNENLEKIERYFNKVKGEIETVERTKDEESKMFQRYNINIDFQVLVQIKETMVDLSSNCMELALKERREANEEENDSEESKMSNVKAERGKRLWRAFQFSFKVYTFAGGHDERADDLTRQLAEEIQTDPEQIDASAML